MHSGPPATAWAQDASLSIGIRICHEFELSLLSHGLPLPRVTAQPRLPHRLWHNIKLNPVLHMLVIKRILNARCSSSFRCTSVPSGARPESPCNADGHERHETTSRPQASASARPSSAILGSSSSNDMAVTFAELGCHASASLPEQRASAAWERKNKPGLTQVH